MSEIPEDIMKAATTLMTPCMRYDTTFNEAVDMAARAILAERERCADLAEKHIYPWSIAAGEELSAAILAGKGRKA